MDENPRPADVVVDGRGCRRSRGPVRPAGDIPAHDGCAPEVTSSAATPTPDDDEPHRSDCPRTRSTARGVRRTLHAPGRCLGCQLSDRLGHCGHGAAGRCGNHAPTDRVGGGVAAQASDSDGPEDGLAAG